MLDEIFYFALHECRNDILSLSSHWTNPLVSSSRFDSQTNGATVLAMTLSGGHPQISLFWLRPTTVDIEVQEDSPEEAHVALNDIIGLQEAMCELVSRTKHVWYSEHGTYYRFEFILERVMSATHVAVILHMRTGPAYEEESMKMDYPDARNEYSTL